MRQTALRLGSSGPFVRDLQLALNNRLNPSPNLKITGIYDTASGRAVRAFQIANWLEPDGCAGPCTLDVLYSLEKTGPILHSVSHVAQTPVTPAWAAAFAMLTHRSVSAILAAVPSNMVEADKSLRVKADPISQHLYRLDLGRRIGLNCHSARNWLAPDLIGLLRKGPLVIECPQMQVGRANSTGSACYLVVAGARGSHSADGSSTTLKIFDPASTDEPIRSRSYLSLLSPFNRMPFAIFTN